MVAESVDLNLQPEAFSLSGVSWVVVAVESGTIISSTADIEPASLMTLPMSNALASAAPAVDPARNTWPSNRMRKKSCQRRTFAEALAFGREGSAAALGQH